MDYLTIKWVPPWEAELRWAEYQPILQKALDRGNQVWTADDILNFIKEDDMQLWSYETPKVEVAVITQVNQYPQKRYCEIILAGSSVYKGPGFWRWAIKQLTQWAKQRDCDAFRVQGRRGWAKLMNWEETAVVVEGKIQ